MPKKSKNLPPIDVLRGTFDCDIQTGIITSKISRTSRRVGERADRAEAIGYRVIWFNGHFYKAHRIVWLFAYGEQPPDCIDHINGDRSDNRICNLRVAPHRMNMCNRPAPRHNTSGVKGVHRRSDNGMYRAYVSVNNKRTRLGQFPSLAEAAAAVREARARLHGEFAKG